MKQFHKTIILVALSSLQLAGFEPGARAMRVNAMKLLRACFPRTVARSGGQLEKDALDKCISGDQDACKSVRKLITSKQDTAVFWATRAENAAINNKTSDVEQIVSDLLDPEAHPCHNLTAPSGEPGKGYPYAKNWIASGCLKKEVEVKYQELVNALYIFQEDRPGA